ncbi:MAG: CGNR zinc finger domain-containing protein [Candidatus Tumulicola sp.]
MGAPRERTDLAGVLVHLGILSFEPGVRPEDLSDALVLRGALDRCFGAASRRDALPARDVDTINSYASDEPPALILRPDGSVARSATDPIRAGLSAIARDAIETIARQGSDLRVCRGDGCGRIFLDRSRGKDRRWCSMARCGNRMKVTAFRRRRRRTPPAALRSDS